MFGTKFIQTNLILLRQMAYHKSFFKLVKRRIHNNIVNNNMIVLNILIINIKL